MYFNNNTATYSVLNFSIQEGIDEMKQSQAETNARQGEMKVELSKTKLQLNGMERKQDQMKVLDKIIYLFFVRFNGVKYI